MMPLTVDKGYQVASKCDKLLNDVMQTHDPEDHENLHGYLALLRTLESTLKIMRRVVHRNEEDML